MQILFIMKSCLLILLNVSPVIVDDVIVLRGSIGLIGTIFLGAALLAGLISWAGPWLAEIQDKELNQRKFHHHEKEEVNDQ